MTPYSIRSQSVSVRRRPGAELAVVSLLKHFSFSGETTVQTRRHCSMGWRKLLQSRCPAPPYSSVFNRFNADSVRNLNPACNCKSFVPSCSLPRRSPAEVLLPYFVLHFGTGCVIHRTVPLASTALRIAHNGDSPA